MEEKIVNQPKIDINRVYTVYTGKPNTCMCGCAGIYKYASSMKEFASKNRGYEVGEEEIDDRRVKVVVGKISRADRVEVIDDYIFTAIIGKTQYTAYLKR